MKNFGLLWISATDFARPLGHEKDDKDKLSAIIIDAVEAMSGMEALVVFNVGLDEKIKQGAQ